MQTPNDSGAREALVRLRELETREEPGGRVELEVAPPVRLREVPALVAKASEPDDLHVLDRERADVVDLHVSLVSKPAIVPP